MLDLGRWWLDETRLPLPLGGNVVRRDLPEEFAAQLSGVLKASIQYGLDHREQALASSGRAVSASARRALPQTAPGGLKPAWDAATLLPVNVRRRGGGA